MCGCVRGVCEEGVTKRLDGGSLQRRAMNAGMGIGRNRLLNITQEELGNYLLLHWYGSPSNAALSLAIRSSRSFT